jgi:hypothetical protein
VTSGNRIIRGLFGEDAVGLAQGILRTLLINERKKLFAGYAKSIYCGFDD